MTVIATLTELPFESKVEVLDSGHVFVGDEPESLGGANKGPNPFSLLQASLADWTIVTLVGVSHEHDIKLTGVKVRVSHMQNIKCDGPMDPKQRSLRITDLRRHIYVQGDFAEGDLDKLLYGANHCPISNSIESAIKITTRIEVEE